MRALITTQRVVPPGRQRDYDSAWRLFRHAALAEGAKAWRFRAASAGGSYIEFLEYAAGADPRSASAVAEGLRALAAIAHGRDEEWIDANLE